MTIPTGSAIVALLMAAVVVAQEPTTFTVASVKVNRGGDTGSFGGATPGGYSLRNGPVSILLGGAFGVSNDRILDAPSWVFSERFDVAARYDAEPGTRPSVAPMLQHLLRERFALRARMEVRDRPVYALRRLSPDRLGPGLQRSDFDCRDVEALRRARAAGRVSANGQPLCATRSTGSMLLATGTTLAALARIFPVDRPVVDRTGLTEAFDVTVRWEEPADSLAQQAAFLTALREQLGLALDATTAAIDVLVVESISRPTPD